MANVDVPTFAAQTRMGGLRTFAARERLGRLTVKTDLCSLSRSKAKTSYLWVGLRVSCYLLIKKYCDLLLTRLSLITVKVVSKSRH
jgi:hypothetical protein